MSPGRPTASPPVTAADLLAALRAARLLPVARLRRLAEAWGGAGEAAARARELVGAGLLTGFQAERVLAGQARALRLGQYRILDRLGAGGMGRVYKAEHRLMRRVVALKVIGRARHAARAAARFRREAKAAAALSHPNIVTAYDAVAARGVLFLVMEHVEGVDLQRLVGAAGPLPVPLACEVARQTARALQYAHERGLVHHDVKPANLLLSQPGAMPPAPDGYDPAAGAVVKLLDLGLARRASATGRANGAEGVEGTPDYMAPERGHGRPADVRSDLYSLGCTLYFLLTGQVPFPGGGWPEKLLRHQLEAPVPVRALRPEVPPAVAVVVERLMAPDPARRYPTPAALLAALEGPGGVAAPVATRRRRRRPSAWLAVAAVLAGTLIGWVGRAAMSRPAPLAHKAPARAIVAARHVTFSVEGRPGRFDTLAGAVAAARSGDVVVVHGPGRARTPPLAWQGKALTLRAAPGGRPVLELTAPEHPWQALLCGDSELTLEGLELRHALPREAGPLVCVEGAALRLSDCGLRSSGGGPLVVSRNGGELTLRGCRLDAGAVGVSVEVGGPCRVTLEGNTLTVRESWGVALSLWSAEMSAPAAADVRLARNTCSAGRAAAFRGLTGPLTVTAEDNHFCFRDGVLSFDHYAPDGWRRTTTWRGRDNRFDGPGAWLRVEGRPAPVRDLAGWQRLWDGSPPERTVDGGGRVLAAPAPNAGQQ